MALLACRGWEDGDYMLLPKYSRSFEEDHGDDHLLECQRIPMKKESTFREMCATLARLATAFEGGFHCCALCRTFCINLCGAIGAQAA